MSVFKISDSVYSVGVLNPNLRVFDVVMRTDFGTSYNSYIIKAEKNVLIETCHLSYYDEYIDNIRQVIDPCDIDYIILNHTEPDHSGALRMLSADCKNAEILCSQAASIYLKSITRLPDFKCRVVKDGEVLDLGSKTLKFISAPFLHWPDSIFTYYESEKVLFTCDFLGAHYCEPRMIDKYVPYPEKYYEGFKGYFDAIFGPFKPYVLKGLDKIKDIEFDTVCPSHGPVLTKEGKLDFALKKYAEWSQPVKRENKFIPIFYTSAYGKTKAAAELMRDEILKIIPNADIPLYNIIEHDMALLGEKLNSSDAFLIGTPTINRDATPPTWQLVSMIDAVNIQKRPCAVFGSYGWSGEAVPAVCQRLKTLKLDVLEDGIRFLFTPGDDDEAALAEYARQFVEKIK